MSLLSCRVLWTYEKHCAGEGKTGLLYLMVLVRAKLVSRIMYVLSLIKKCFIKNKWPLGSDIGNNWPGRLLGTSMTKSLLSWNDLP